MSKFLLIHGSWHGAWCWNELVAQLEQQGHSAKAIDLPGHGADSRLPNDVTFTDYVNAVVDVLKSENETSILVGHSMAGQVTQAAETVPDRVRGVVYVTGILTPNGVPMMRVIERLDPEYLGRIIMAPDGRTAMMPLEGARSYFYPLCPDEVARSAASRLTPEPIAPLETPIWTTRENFGRVPKFYIECLQDRVFPIEVQRSMHSTQSWKQIFSINTDHSPFFSAIHDLVSILSEVSRQVG